MKTKTFLTLLVVVVCAASAPAQKAKPRKLDTKAKTAIKRAIAKYVKTPVDDKPAMLGEFMRYGRLGLEFLDELKEKTPAYSADVSLIRHRAKTMLGLDLLEREHAKKRPKYHPDYFAFGEIVLFKRDGDVFGGLRVLDTLDGTEGKIEVETWLQTGPGKTLVQPGGLSGVATVEGTKCPKTLRPNTAYEEFEFPVKAGDVTVTIRFIGPAYFLVKLDGSTEFAVTGLDKAKKIRASDPHHYVQSPDDLARARELMTEYLFRVVPGCEPLKLDESERDAFAQYEAVQVEARYERPGGAPILLVKFPEPGALGFTDLEDAYLRNFAYELLPIPEENVLVMGGMSAGYEGNKFWKDGKWRRPSKGIIEILRKQFVEDY